MNGRKQIKIETTQLHARIQGGGGWGRVSSTLPPPLEKHKNIGFLSNTVQDPLENHNATRSAFDVGPLSARQQNAI